MVSARNNVRYLPVEAFESTRASLPHLAAGLIEHLAITHDVLVLLHNVAGAKHSLNFQMVNIIGNPRRTEFEQRLVDVILDIALRVAKQNH